MRERSNRRRRIVGFIVAARVLAGSPHMSVLGQARPSPCDVTTQESLPVWFRMWFTEPGRLGPHARYDIACDLNPFYRRGNFEGQGQLDLAVLVVERSSGKRGVLIVHRPGFAYYVLGAGTRIGNGGDDFEWMDVWSVDSVPLSWMRALPRMEAHVLEKVMR